MKVSHSIRSQCELRSSVRMIGTKKVKNNHRWKKGKNARMALPKQTKHNMLTIGKYKNMEDVT